MRALARNNLRRPFVQISHFVRDDKESVRDDKASVRILNPESAVGVSCRVQGLSVGIGNAANINYLCVIWSYLRRFVAAYRPGEYHY